jgi:hypothetical protein
VAKDEEELPPTRAEALTEIAKAIRELPAANMSAQRQVRLQPKGSIAGLMETLADVNDPKTQREFRRERTEEKRAKRTERRANIALAIAAVGAIGSVLVLILR